MDRDLAARKPRIAISGCIIGQRVRYDGELKHFPDIQAYFQSHAELVPVCPEVEIGLSVPRPPVQLTGNPNHPAMTGRDDPGIDISEPMYAFCEQKPRLLHDVCGYIFKSKSPSCGIRDIPVFDQAIPRETRAGLFAQAMMTAYPALPVSDETQLQTEAQRCQFLQRVLNYCHQLPTNTS